MAVHPPGADYHTCTLLAPLPNLYVFVLSLLPVTEYRLRDIDSHWEDIRDSLLKDPSSKSLPSILLVADNVDVNGKLIKTVKDVLGADLNKLK